MIITNGKLLYHYFTTSRDYITGETATEEAMNECIELVGGSDSQKEYTRFTLHDIMTIVKGVELID